MRRASPLAFGRTMIEIVSICSKSGHTEVPRIGSVFSTASSGSGKLHRGASLHLPNEAHCYELAQRAARGALALVVCQGVIQLANLVGNIVLARALTPREYGYYGVTLTTVALLSSAADAGLFASLVRSNGEPSEHDRRSVFTFQQLLAVVGVLLFGGVSPYVAGHFGVPRAERFVFLVASLSVLATPLQAASALRLERELAFTRLALVELAQALLFNAMLVILALRGMGVWSFAPGLLLRTLLGAVLVRWMSPWRVGWCLDWTCIKRHLDFGIPYQAAGFLFLLKDSIVPVLVGAVAGAAAVGYLSWATTVATYSALALLVLQRVYLTAFARLQNDRSALGHFVERVIWASNALSAPLSVLMLALFEPFTLLIYGSRWLAARDYFMLLWVANLFMPTSIPILGLLNALGRAKTVTLFALFWTAGTWFIGTPMILTWGALGYALACSLMNFTDLALFRAAQRLVTFRIFAPIVPAWSIAAAVGTLAWLVQLRFPARNSATFVAYGGAGVVLYLLGILAIDRNAIKNLRRLFRANPRLESIPRSPRSV